MRRLTRHVCFLLTLIAAVSAQAQPVVVAVSPLPQAIQADYHTDIIVDFDRQLNMASIDASSMRVFGRWSGPMTGTITLESSSTRLRFHPVESFFAGEWVTVAVSKSVEEKAGTPMAQSYTWNFWVRAGPGTMDLTSLGTVSVRYPAEGWIQSYGSYAGDLNNDGWTDMSIPNEQSGDVRVFLNDGVGNYSTFSATAVPNDANPSTNEGADFDHDGEIDIVIGNALGSTVSVFLGNGAGGWKSTTPYVADGSVRGVGVVDLNCDGWDDIVTSNRFGDNMALFLNDGDGTFGAARFMDSTGSAEFGLAVADANNDGLLDVFVGTYNTFEIILLTSDGVDSLVYSDKVTVTGRPWMLAVGDMNNDGNVDVVSANSFGNVATVVFGDGAGNLSAPVTYATGEFPLAIDVGDIDGDGDLDLVTSNYDGIDWTVYENLGAGVLGNVRSLAASSAGSCAILHDRDNDRDLDMTGIDELDDDMFIFDNDPGPTAVGDTPSTGIHLLQNHPNPFNPVTTIRFSLDSPAAVTLAVHDVEGRLVKILADGAFAAGAQSVSWNGIAGSGARAGSGVYFYVLRSEGRALPQDVAAQVVLPLLDGPAVPVLE